jgi:hypothetical protein
MRLLYASRMGPRWAGDARGKGIACDKERMRQRKMAHLSLPFIIESKIFIMAAATDPYYDDTHAETDQDVCRDGYVRVVCNGGILQIREDVVNQSQCMSLLASARPADNLSKCIHMANELATPENVKVICDWIAKHIEFANRMLLLQII